MVKVLDFKSKLDVLLPNKQKKLITNTNQSKLAVKWFKYLKDEMIEFEKQCDKKNLLQLEIKPEKISYFISIINQWMIYINNVLIDFSSKQIQLDADTATFLSVFLPRYILQIFENVIISLSDFKSFSMEKFYQNYIDDSLNQISKEIIENKSDLLIFCDLMQTIPVNRKIVLAISNKIRRRIRKVGTLYNSLIDLEEIKDDSTKLNELLLEFKLQHASDRLKTAYGFYNKGIWDKAVGDMRFVLEITVKYIARVILKDMYWDQPYKDGIDILTENGIIKDRITAKHFILRHVGVYGILSMKGHHAEGISDENLASSELEAKYFMSLTENVIEYLLTSFRETEFYESDESDT